VVDENKFGRIVIRKLFLAGKSNGTQGETAANFINSLVGTEGAGKHRFPKLGFPRGRNPIKLLPLTFIVLVTSLK